MTGRISAKVKREASQLGSKRASGAFPYTVSAS
jgi:hypothetical protein